MVGTLALCPPYEPTIIVYAVIARSVSDEAIHLWALLVATWIASRSLSSGARSRDPLARNDELNKRAGITPGHLRFVLAFALSAVARCRVGAAAMMPCCR
jgi:hypothetical protein